MLGRSPRSLEPFGGKIIFKKLSSLRYTFMKEFIQGVVILFKNSWTAMNGMQIREERGYQEFCATR
jgi:hypothetical protein